MLLKFKNDAGTEIDVESGHDSIGGGCRVR